MILEEARDVCREAARLAPDDPVPYIIELGVARGLPYRQADFEELWTKVIDRAPHHMGAHLAALHYWCEKWHGSQDRADRFTHAAAAPPPARASSPRCRSSRLRAPPRGQPRPQPLPERRDHQGGRGRPVRRPPGPRRRPGPAPRPPSAGLVPGPRSERYADAMEQLRHVDGHVGAVPWSYGADPAAEYAVYRALAVAGWEGHGGSPATLPQVSRRPAGIRRAPPPVVRDSRRCSSAPRSPPDAVQPPPEPPPDPRGGAEGPPRTGLHGPRPPHRPRQPPARPVPARAWPSPTSASAASGARSASSGRPPASGPPWSATRAATPRTPRTKRCAAASPPTPRPSASSSTPRSPRTAPS